MFCFEDETAETQKVIVSVCSKQDLNPLLNIMPYCLPHVLFRNNSFRQTSVTYSNTTLFEDQRYSKELNIGDRGHLGGSVS